MLRIRRNDKVLVFKGKDKGKVGIVSKVVFLNKKCKRKIGLMVEGVNLVKKCVKSNPNKNSKGGIVSTESFIYISNVRIINILTNKLDKVRFKYLDNDKKVRVFKTDGSLVDKNE